MAITTYKWSIEEWHELVDLGAVAGKPVELLNGEIIKVSPEGIEHSYSNQSIADYLRILLQDRAYIRNAHPITLDNSEPEPDIAIVRLPASIYKQHHPYADNIYWLIEVSKNTLKIDLETKSAIYARNGIPEYWVIDLVNKKLIVHTQPNNDFYIQVKELTSGTIAPLSFPNLNIDLERLLLF